MRRGIFDAPNLVKAKEASTQTLVDLLHQRGELTDLKVQEAFAAVPRHIFLPDTTLETVYSDTSVPVCYDDSGEIICSATMPSMVAFMLDQLDLRNGDNVLEIGTGTGYIAALIRYIVGHKGTVTSLEIDHQIAKLAQDNLQRAVATDAKVVHVDGSFGYAPRAQYDRIVSAAGIWDIPAAWLTQLKPRGRIVAPVSIDGLQVVGGFTVQPDGSLLSQHLMPSSFVYIRGDAAGPRIRKRIGSTSLNVIADEIDKVDAAALHLMLSQDYETSLLSNPLNTTDYWYGFLPYLMLSERKDQIFALYDIPGDQQAYGINGEGFALICPGSAVFIPYYGSGRVHGFAGADAMLEIEEHLHNWNNAGRPGLDRLRLRFVAKESGRPEPVANVQTQQVYGRRDHYLQVWLEG